MNPLKGLPLRNCLHFVFIMSNENKYTLWKSLVSISLSCWGLSEILCLSFTCRRSLLVRMRSSWNLDGDEVHTTNAVLGHSRSFLSSALIMSLSGIENNDFVKQVWFSLPKVMFSAFRTLYSEPVQTNSTHNWVPHQQEVFSYIQR